MTEHKELEDRLHRQAFTDALTGLANRPLFIDRLDHVLSRRRREGESAFAVLFLDVDDFKTVNDSLGHSAGDQLLVTLAQRLETALRPDDTAARLGGDEFAVLLERTAENDARQVANRLLASIAEPVVIGEHAVHVTVSLGIAVDVGEAHVNADDVLRDADLAMYSAKSTAPGTYAVYEPHMDDRHSSASMSAPTNTPGQGTAPADCHLGAVSNRVTEGEQRGDVILGGDQPANRNGRVPDVRYRGSTRLATAAARASPSCSTLTSR